MFQPILLPMTAKYGFEDSGDEPLQDQPHSSHRILVVEDERDLRQITAEVLIDAGYHVDVAEDAAAAWHTLQLSKYDLLITNQFMPKVSGVELLKKIHAARLALPVIVDTGNLPTWEFTVHTWLKPVKMLLNPYSFEKLLDLVKQMLSTTASTAGNSPLPPLPPEPQLPRRIA